MPSNSNSMRDFIESEREARGLTQAEAARLFTGKTEKELPNKRAGNRWHQILGKKNYSDDEIAKIAEIIGSTPKELQSAKTQIDYKKQAILGVVTIEEDKPYYGNLMAIGGIGALVNNPDNIHPTDSIRVPNSGADFYIPVFGDSMYPKYCAGETVGLKKIDKEFVMFGHAYVVELENGEAYIKYIRKGQDEDHWILASENSKYEPREFHLRHIRGVYMIKVILTKTSIT